MNYLMSSSHDAVKSGFRVRQLPGLVPALPSYSRLGFGWGIVTLVAYNILGSRTAYSYDQFGNLASVTDPLGHATVYESDLRGRKTYEGGATYPVRYAYDLFGNKVSMTTYRDEDAHKGDVTQWLYDEASNCMTNKVYADGKGPSYDYDAYGRLVKRIWARGVVTIYTYDDWGALTRTDYSDDTPSVVLSYDAMGRQTQAIDAAGVTTFAYDSFGSLTNETVVGVAGTNTIEHFYDVFGRDAGYALNGVRQSTLSYDAANGRLASMQIPAIEDEQNHCPPPPLFSTFQWTYLAGSDLKSSLTYPNSLTASWIYDANNKLLQVCNATPTNIISQYDYMYDAAGRRINVSKTGTAFTQDDAIAYDYNARSELTNAVAAVDSDYRYSYAFDDIGNRESSSERGTNSVYTANQLNQYTEISDSALSASPRETFTPQFDDDGNQTLIKTATGIWSVTYNGENRPVLWENVSTNSPTPNSSTPPLISMSFDRMCRRVTKNAQRFIYDGYLQIADNSGNAYVWDPTESVATRPLVWQRSALGTQHSTLFYTHDGNKNVSEVIASNNDVSAHYEYAPFGALTVSRGTSATANSWRFSSEYAEDDTATVYYNYRHYEPVTGRWLGRDPLGENAGACLYAILHNISVCAVDVLGMHIFEKYCTVDKITEDSDWKLEKYKYKTISANNGFQQITEIETTWVLHAEVECCCWSWWHGFGRRSYKVRNKISKRVKYSSQLPKYYYAYTPTGLTSIPSPVTLSQLLGEIAAATLSEIMSGIEMFVDRQSAIELFEAVKNMKPKTTSEGFWPADKCNED